METAKINKVLIGEALVGDGNEVAHVDLIIGPRGLAQGQVEPKNRRTGEKEERSMESALERLTA